MTSTGLKIASLLVGLLGVILLYYMYYLILIHIHATDLMWFLYTIAIPFVFIGAIISKLIDWGNK